LGQSKRSEIRLKKKKITNSRRINPMGKKHEDEWNVVLKPLRRESAWITTTTWKREQMEKKWK